MEFLKRRSSGSLNILIRYERKKQCMRRLAIPKNNMTELYFEEPDIERFIKKLEKSDFEIEYVNKCK